MKASTLLIGGGVVASVTAYLLARKTSGNLREAMNAPAGSQPTFKAHLTGYWPFVAGLSAAERKMEGGTKDRRGNPLYTLEDFQAGKAPYVSVAGDYEVFPYGQRVGISAWPSVTFRVVDTGGHFHGVNKVYRVVGEEPLDVCVASASTAVPKKNVTATIYPGDNFEEGRAVATAGMRNQSVVLGAAEAIVGAYFDALEEGMS